MLQVYTNDEQYLKISWRMCNDLKINGSISVRRDREQGSVYSCWLLKVRGPFVETPRIFLCMQNINYAEILAWKNDYYFKIISDRGLTFVPA